MSGGLIAPYYADDSFTLFAGDCLDVMPTLGEHSVDAVVCDPPYGLGFMGKAWDSPGGTGDFPMRRFDAINTVNTGASRQGGRQRSTVDFARRQARDARAYGEWCGQWAAECLRVLKPGGHMLAFGGTRTYHRIACAVEDAGFEIRDSISWLYGSGFPKSLDVSKAIDRAAGAEREVVGAGQWAGRESPADLGVMNDDAWQGGAQRLATAPATDAAKQWQGWGTALKPAHEPIVVARRSTVGTVAANVAEHGTGALNIDACRVEYEAGGSLASNSSLRTHINGGNGGEIIAHEDERRVVIPNAAGRWPTNVVLDESQAEALDAQTGVLTSGGGDRRSNTRHVLEDRLDRNNDTPRIHDTDSGGASRFFPTFRYEAKAPAYERPSVDGVLHPTVKPLDLMRWLVRLVTPPGGLVLDPFLGSGTTAEACILENLHCIGIEREPDYLPLIVQRISKPLAVGFDFGEATA